LDEANAAINNLSNEYKVLNEEESKILNELLDKLRTGGPKIA